MHALWIALLMVGIGVQAYRRARRDGTWSWREFGVTLAGFALIMGIVIPWALFLSRLGPDHAGLATVLVLVPIVVGVVLLAVYLAKRQKRRT